MPGSFASLPSHERQAFFSLLDEYFQSRPHLLPGGGAHNDIINDEAEHYGYQQPTATTSASPPAPVPRSQPPPPTARKPASSLVHKAASPPAGLSSGKSIGRIDMKSKGAAFGSMVMGKPKPEAPATPGEAITGTTPRAPNTTSRIAPPPAPHVQQPEAAAFGQAEVVYDYNGTESEDLSVKRFQIVDLIEKISEDWWKARSDDGREGIVPSTYVKQI